METKSTLNTLCEILPLMRNRPKGVALRYKKNSEWIDLNWQEYYNEIEKMGLALLELGLSPGDRVGIFANTRLEWCIADFAVLGAAGVVVPMYQTVTAEDLEFMLNNSECRILFLENRSLLRTFNAIKARCPSVQTVILMNVELEDITEAPGGPRWLTWSQAMQLGSERLSRGIDEFAQLAKKAVSSDPATVIYTSGTTGRPKGVVLSHLQGASEIHDAFQYVGVTPADISLTFLPYAHILGRIEHWGQAYIGFTMAFAESIEKIRSNLTDIKPTIMVAVPRIFEKIYGVIWSQAESNFLVNRMFRWGVAVGLKVGDYRIKHEPIPLHLLGPYELAQKLVLSKIKEAFGGRLRFAVSGGAPLARDIALFFHAADVLILEGYGLTETTAAITVNAPFDYRFGSVGKPFGDTQIKIAADGEILIKGDKVMKEYYKDPVATAETLKEGWFATGDIGEILPSGDLMITDRKKDLIKTAGGKYVAPQKLENLLKTTPLISQILIHGDQKKYIVALMTLDEGQLKRFAKENGLEGQSYSALTQNPLVLENVRKVVAETNKQLASFETIKRFSILPKDFTVESGELTPSLKVKRKLLDKKYSHQIELLYK
jgi:long-chain acyl-CoA synthetase